MRVFVTGISGSLGSALALLHAGRGDQVWGCSRSEERAVAWLRQHRNVGTLFLANASSLADRHSDAGRLLPSMDRVYHAAAMKHVDTCEAQPAEAVAQNVGLTAVVASACREAGVGLVFVSSDKACLPQGVYGATKLLAERVVLREGGAVVRLGNLIGSSGSVFAAWAGAVRARERVSLTDPDMTRYFLPVDVAARFLAESAEPGKVVIPDPLRAAVMGELAKAVAGPLVTVVGRRPGETLHQWLAAPGERVKRGNGAVLHARRLVLAHDGEPLADGLCSATAERWDTGELLRAAGVSA